MKVEIAFHIPENGYRERVFYNVISVHGNETQIRIMQETLNLLIPHYFEVENIRSLDITED